MAFSQSHVVILMATHNGAAFLDDQLASIRDQTHTDWSLWISDDASTDATRDVIQAFASAHPRLDIRLTGGPGRGSTANFLSLLCHPDLPAGWVALADQDDVWLPGKLTRALTLTGHSALPVLYGARTIITDTRLSPIGLSPDSDRAPSFSNALVQSFAGGNTMLLNAAALRLVRAAGADVAPACHDWWLYQLVTGAGGTAVFDRAPVLLYRQHGRNQIGANSSVRARLARAVAVAQGRMRRWNDCNLAALRQSASLLAPANRDLVTAFDAARGKRGLSAMMRLRAAGITRRSPVATASLALAAAIGRL